MQHFQFPPTHLKRRRQKAGRGFTLIELMVALTGGIFFSVFVFMITQSTSKIFQSEARISEAMLTTMSGFERLRNDIARAGFLSSANLYRDQNRCPRPALGGGAPNPPEQAGTLAAYPGLAAAALARIIPDTVTAGTGELAGNVMLSSNVGGLNPDQLVLWGNYSTADQFDVRTIDVGGGAGGRVYLETGTAALARIGIPSGAEATDLAILGNAFGVGRIIRFVDETNRDQYGIVASVQYTSFGAQRLPTINLNAGVGLIEKSTNSQCGFRAHSTGTSVNPVNIIRYKLQNLNNSAIYGQFGLLYSGSTAASDSTRLELIREELSPLGAPTTLVPAQILTTELIAEYAVDLKFGVTALTSTAAGVLSYFGEDDANLPRYAGVPTSVLASGADSGPHLIRGIHARLAVRSRKADLQAAALAPLDLAAATSEDIFRVQVAPNEFARMRSLRSHVATRNSGTALWQ